MYHTHSWWRYTAIVQMKIFQWASLTWVSRSNTRSLLSTCILNPQLSYNQICKKLTCIWRIRTHCATNISARDHRQFPDSKPSRTSNLSVLQSDWTIIMPTNYCCRFVYQTYSYDPDLISGTILYLFWARVQRMLELSTTNEYYYNCWWSKGVKPREDWVSYAMINKIFRMRRLNLFEIDIGINTRHRSRDCSFSRSMNWFWKCVGKKRTMFIDFWGSRMRM